MFQYDFVLFVDGLLNLHGQQETHLVRLEISSPHSVSSNDCSVFYSHWFQVKAKRNRNILPEFKNKINCGNRVFYPINYLNHLIPHII